MSIGSSLLNTPLQFCVKGVWVSDLYSWSISSIPDYTSGEIPAPGLGWWNR